MSNAEDLSARNRVPGAESGRRLLAVLLSFTESRPLWTVADLATELDMGTSMVYRYIALLREVGLVDAAHDSQYRVTDLAASLAAASAAVRAPIAATSLPVISRIRDEIGETVLVARRSGSVVYTVERAESNRPVRLQFERGQAMSLHVGSLSRVLLAHLPHAEREAYVAQLADDVRSLPTLAPVALDEVVSQGFAESFEEIDDGIWGVAAPLFSGGAVAGAIGCAAPLYRTPAEQRNRIRAAIRAGAEEISREL
ncbi:IclR family transcriptional regulator [Microbacterium sp. 1.5R]|uniref:IclR family transcriptional regulator n=1 Tax=Microbacterium sp. 1.5R TaxID=1916917 RepID=UPI0011A994AA|nr:IclR family transcriptional regulator [Microbacterium sp. 1.5R]